MSENNINLIYDKLLKTYSYQGWWPIIGYDGSNPTKTGAVKGYHPNDYSFPRNSNEQFEIIMGSVLTQNTSWPSVEKALNNLSLLSDFQLKIFLNWLIPVKMNLKKLFALQVILIRNLIILKILPNFIFL